MRILHSLFTKSLAGTERYVTDLCNFQAKTHDVALLVRYDHQLTEGLSFLSWLSSNVEILKVPKRFPVPWMVWHVLKWKPDIIHSHHKRDVKYIGRYIKRKRKVGTLHIAYQKAYRHCDGLICITNWQRNSIPAEFTGRVTHISNWLPSYSKGLAHQLTQNLRQSLGIPEGSYVVGSVGRFAPEKGYADLAKAFCRANLPRSYLVIVGDGPEREAILRKHVDTRIIFPGATVDPSPYYELFDLFVLPSRFESFGLVLLEAMNAGLPIISTRLPGPMEILPQSGVEWAAAGKVDTLSCALVNCYKRRAHKPVVYDLKEFALDKQAKKIHSFYELILSDV